MRNFTAKRLRSKRSCARGSFRTVKFKGGRRLVICCPRGHYSAGRCKVGTRGYELLTPRSR